MSSTPGATWLMTNAYQHIVERAAKVNIWNKRLGKYQERQGNSNFSVKNIWICMRDCIHTKPCTPTLVEFKVTVTNATFNITRSLTRNVTVILYMWLTKALKRICGMLLCSAVCPQPCIMNALISAENQRAAGYTGIPHPTLNTVWNQETESRW